MWPAPDMYIAGASSNCVSFMTYVIISAVVPPVIAIPIENPDATPV